MTNIGVYTTNKTLNNKIKHTKNPEFYTWWTLPQLPKKAPEHVFFASQGVWRGYFTIEKIEVIFDEMKIFLDDWHPIDQRIERSQFQGFTYNVPTKVIE